MNIGDNEFNLLHKGEIKGEEGQPPQVIGLQSLRILKLNGLVKIQNNGIIALCKCSQFLEHLELTRCEAITEFAVNTIIQ